MEYFVIDCPNRECRESSACGANASAGQVHVSRFVGEGGVREYHLTLRSSIFGREGFENQMTDLLSAYRHALDVLQLPANTTVFRRYFCSDLANQASALGNYPMANPRNPDVPCAISWIGQPPAPPAKASLWAYHVDDPKGELEKKLDGRALTLRRGALAHRWTFGLSSDDTAVSPGDIDVSGAQTRGILNQYNEMLNANNETMADNVVRTWFYIRGIDTNYKGMAAARREFFARHGLTPQTHFIASTGIEGAPSNPKALVACDAYSIGGVESRQIEYINAPDNLCPTHIYGVTFERASSVAWRDRKHVLLSGTASIDNQGTILHSGDVAAQMDRTIENLAALLKQAGAGFEDAGVLLVYLRDPADHALVWRKMRERFANIPFEILTAPVCRPGWLIEIEGIASVPCAQAEYPEF